MSQLNHNFERLLTLDFKQLQELNLLETLIYLGSTIDLSPEELKKDQGRIAFLQFKLKQLMITRKNNEQKYAIKSMEKECEAFKQIQRSLEQLIVLNQQIAKPKTQGKTVPSKILTNQDMKISHSKKSIKDLQKFIAEKKIAIAQLRQQRQNKTAKSVKQVIQYDTFFQFEKVKNQSSGLLHYFEALCKYLNL